MYSTYLSYTSKSSLAIELTYFLSSLYNYKMFITVKLQATKRQTSSSLSYGFVRKYYLNLNLWCYRENQGYRQRRFHVHLHGLYSSCLFYISGTRHCILNPISDLKTEKKKMLSSNFLLKLYLANSGKLWRVI